MFGQVLGPGAQRLRGTGEAVAEEHAHFSALVAERLCSREDGHHSLLVGEGFDDDETTTRARAYAYVRVRRAV
ncbi:hypothetical protein GCM10010302_13250 [Streptomyces polychromogenes]|uniref:Uncharacterized protein n=1 Tax=Streptomyces polychromogenes TaxID=67342 RepID=A0ABP3EW54_9ACTN